MASPRLVTGANTRAPSSSGSTTTAWVASACPGALPTSGTLSAVSSPWVRVAALSAGVAEPDQRVPAEVRDQERDLVGVQLVGKALPEHIRGRERRGVLDGRQQLCEVEMGGRLDGRSLVRRPIAAIRHDRNVQAAERRLARSAVRRGRPRGRSGRSARRGASRGRTRRRAGAGRGRARGRGASRRDRSRTSSWPRGRRSRAAHGTRRSSRVRAARGRAPARPDPSARRDPAAGGRAVASKGHHIPVGQLPARRVEIAAQHQAAAPARRQVLGDRLVRADLGQLGRRSDRRVHLDQLDIAAAQHNTRSGHGTGGGSSCRNGARAATRTPSRRRPAAAGAASSEHSHATSPMASQLARHSGSVLAVTSCRATTSAPDRASTSACSGWRRTLPATFHVTSRTRPTHARMANRRNLGRQSVPTRTSDLIARRSSIAAYASAMPSRSVS